MIQPFLIFLGAGLGGIARHGVSLWIHRILGFQFPYGTLFVNISGSFLMGFLFILTTHRFEITGNPLRTMILVGFLGGYTTFSSFSLETLQLFEHGTWSLALLNSFLSLVCCILMTWIGMILGRMI